MRYSTEGVLIAVNFGFVVNLSNNPTTSEVPEKATAVSGQNVYVIWRDNSPGNLDIFFRGSTDSGVSFGAIENLSNNPGDSLNSHMKTMFTLFGRTTRPEITK